MSSDTGDPSGWRPDRIQTASTAAVVAIALLMVLSPGVREQATALGLWLTEVIGRLVDRPTGLVVAAYAVVTLAAAVLELLGSRRPREAVPVWVALCGLAVLGQGYVLAFAWKLRPGWLVVALLAAGVAGGLTRSRRKEGLDLAPVVTLFVGLHVLAEGVAGHILTPLQHVVSATAASWSRGALGPGVIFACVAVGPALVGHVLVRSGARPLDWPHVDPRRLVDALAVPSLAALGVLSAHYGTTLWSCPPADAEGLRLVSPEAGAFDIETTATTLLVSLREPQQLLVVDRATGESSLRSTREEGDSPWSRTEPETLLALGGSEFVVLLADSGGEDKNRLVLLDLAGAAPPLELHARGISDLVDDGAGGLWMGAEGAGTVQRFFREPTDGVGHTIPGAETNKIVAEAATSQLWSVGLWRDPMLRQVDLRTGQQLGAVRVGTHQWDLALSASRRLLFVPKFLSGRILAHDADTLEARGELPGSFGVRPAEVSPDGALVVTGNLYTGAITGWSVDSGELRFRRPIGGYVKALEIADDGTIYAGSVCGVFEVLP